MAETYQNKAEISHQTTESGKQPSLPPPKIFFGKKNAFPVPGSPGILQVLQLFLQALHQRIFIHRRGGFRLDFDVLHRRGEGQGAVALLEIRQGWA